MLTYHIEHDERDDIRATVRRNGHTVFEIGGEQGVPLHEMRSELWMRHKADLTGLRNYLEHVGIAALDEPLRMC